jgi:glycosyltransferase involved in cell wall biosynthesis
MDIVHKIKRLVGLPEISQARIRSFVRTMQGSLPKERTPQVVGTIAVVVPCYNHAGYLDRMFESILCQTRKPDEVIFVNDSSPDDTSEKLHYLTERYESSGIDFRVIDNERNIGQSASLNKAIREVTSDLVMILNDDDYLFHDAVEFAIDIVNNNTDVRLVGATSVHFDTDDRLEAENKYIRNMLDDTSLELTFRYPGDVLRYKDYNDLNMTHSGSCFLKSAWEAVGGYRPDKRQRLVPFSDRDFQLRVNALFPVAISSKIPFSFWRSNSSVDRGVDS